MTNLTKRYEELSLSQRVESIRVAELEGEEAAANDAGAAGGVEQTTASLREYVSYVVEPAWSSDLATDEELDYWRHDPDVADDPRLTAFIRGWEHKAGELLATQRETEADIAAELDNV